MDLIDPQVGRYVEALVPDREPELQAMEQYAREQKFPIIGPACGHLCYLLARAIGARSVFELGSGFGYSTAFFARAVRENGGGVVHHVVWEQGLSDRARGHLGRLGHDGIVRYHVSEAVAALSKTEGPFDLVFNDIDKAHYPDSLPAIEEKLRPGGLLIVDNMLWSGRIFEPSDTSADTRGVRELTRLISTRPGWISSVLPIRDGLLVALRV